MIEVIYGFLTVASPIAALIGLGVLVNVWGRRNG